MRSKHANPVTAILVVALVAAIGWRIAAARDDDSTDEPSADLHVADTATDDEGTTFDRRPFDVGDCVYWKDQGSYTDTDVVPCDEPHISEVVGRSDLARDATYPTHDEWERFYDERCRPLAEKHLGTGLDPFGRVVTGVFRPTERGFAAGDRVVWCTLEVDGPGPGRHELVSQPAAELDQAKLADPGTCLAIEGTDGVDCATPHDFEVLSVLDLSGRTERPSDTTIFARCGGVPRGTSAPSGGRLDTTFVGFEAESWAAGTRKGMCVVVAYGPDQEPVAQTGRMLPTA